MTCTGDMGEHLDLYDTINFSPDHPQYSRANHRVLAKMKSETGSVQPSEFVGLRAEMYILKAPASATKKPRASRSTTCANTCATSSS